MSLICYLLSLISGAVLTTQVAINGRLRSNLSSPILTSFISFAVGAIGLALIYVISILHGVQSKPDLENVRNTTWWMWIGGLLGAFYIFTTIFTSPKIGFANMFSLVVAGQIIFAIIFDHFGVFGNEIHLISPVRTIGVILLIISVYIIQTH